MLEASTFQIPIWGFLRWKLRSQMDSGAFVKITWKLKKNKNKIPKLRYSEFLMKLKLPSCVTQEF